MAFEDLARMTKAYLTMIALEEERAGQSRVRLQVGRIFSRRPGICLVFMVPPLPLPEPFRKRTDGRILKRKQVPSQGSTLWCVFGVPPWNSDMPFVFLWGGTMRPWETRFPQRFLVLRNSGSE